MNPSDQRLLELYPHAESDLADQSGLAHDALKATRAEILRRGTDWELVKGRVRYTQAAMSRTLSYLKICDEAPAAEPPPPGPAAAAHSAPNPAGQKITAAAGELRELVVTKRCAPNRRMVLATLEGAEQRVKVRDNINLIAGMKMQCRLIQGNLWDLAQRLPRWRGRW